MIKADDLASITSSVVLIFGLYLSWRAHKREESFRAREETFRVREESFRAREETFRAVQTSESLKSFKKPIKHCEQVTITLSNLSKTTTTIKVDVLAVGLCVHKEQGDIHDTICNDVLHLPHWTIAPDKNYEVSFRIHARQDLPAQASVTLHVNDKIFSQLTYYYDQQSCSYMPHESCYGNLC